MKAAVLHGKEDVRIQEIAPFPLGAGEVRRRIKAALTCGTDLKVFKRGYHAKMIVPPAVFGHELAGVISELGSGVPALGWAIADRVVVIEWAERLELVVSGQWSVAAHKMIRVNIEIVSETERKITYDDPGA